MRLLTPLGKPIFKGGFYVAPPPPFVPVLTYADAFNGTAGTSIHNRTPDTGTNPWQSQNISLPLLTGTGQVEAGSAGGTTPFSRGSVISTGLTDCTIEVIAAFTALTNTQHGIAFNYVDISNFWTYRVKSGGGVDLIRVVAGSSLTAYTFTDATMTSPVTLKIDIKGDNLTLYINGALQTTFNEVGRAHKASTLHGVRWIATDATRLIEDFKLFTVQ